MSSSQTETGSGKTTTKRRVARSRIAELEEELKKEKDKSIQYLDRLKYLQADFDNYRKRTLKIIEEVIKEGNEKLIVKLLTVLDNLESAVVVGTETTEKNAILDGLKLVLKEFRETLKQEGLVEIEALGKPFDPNQHESVRQTETSDFPENTVTKELRKGYTLNGKVIRPTMVEIAKKPETVSATQ